MTPSRSDLTLPGDIPGLLRRGSPVIIGNTSALVECPSMPCGTGGVFALFDGGVVDFDGVDPSDVSLDLTDPTGRTHAAWWLARWWQQHRAGGASPLPLMGSVWHRCGDTSWRLSWCYTDTTWGINVPIAPTYVEVPSLAHMSGATADDPRTLPDGSRWVDAEALRRVVLHVAGGTT